MTALVEVVRDVTQSGSLCLRAVDAHGGPLAVAIQVDGRWVIGAYTTGVPAGELSARSEADAREWVRWIGEQIARDRADIGS